METTKNTKLYFGRPGSVYGLLSLISMLCITLFQVMCGYKVLVSEEDRFAELLIYFAIYIAAEWVYYFI